MKKRRLDYVEFYITNACNLGCNNCNRFNNYFFAGSWKWNDYKDIYTKWSSIVDLEIIGILGGEPFLNPSLTDYVEGIHSLWPDANLEIVTNGSYLNKKDYYDIFKKCKVELKVSAHTRERYPMLEQEICKYLRGNITKTFNLVHNEEKKWVDVFNNVIRAETWPTVQCFRDWETLPEYIKEECVNLHKISPTQFIENTAEKIFVDENGVTAKLSYAEGFYSAPLKYDGNNKFFLYNSDPEEAHDNCLSKFCHHFIAGKLYKCHQVGLLPLFLKQFHVEISDEDLKLLDSYIPATVDMSDQQFDNFFNSIKDTIPQCKLCPVNNVRYPVESVNNKARVKKIIQ